MTAAPFVAPAGAASVPTCLRLGICVVKATHDVVRVGAVHDTRVAMSALA